MVEKRDRSMLQSGVVLAASHPEPDRGSCINTGVCLLVRRVADDWLHREASAMTGPATATLIVLHGHGDSEENTLSWAASLVPATWRLRAVSAPPGNSEDRSWFDTAPRGVDRPGFDRSLNRVTAAVAEAAEQGPVVLAGFSQGAAMALGVPSMVGLVGVVGLCGFLPELDAIDLSSGPPVLLLAGESDEVAPAFLSVDAAAALRAAGREATAQMLPGGHEVSEGAAHRTREWLDTRFTPRRRTSPGILAEPVETGTELVLASGSPYRARILSDAGYRLVIDPPEVDERAADHLLHSLGPGGLAMELARRKAEAVAPRHPGAVVFAGDQVGVVEQAGVGERLQTKMLNKQPDVPRAVEQLMVLSGTTHHLHNGMYLLDVDTGECAVDVDVQRVTMRRFTRSEAIEYVERFLPFDTAGSYRMEDAAEMHPGTGFVVEVMGEDDSGVLGVPLPMLARMVTRLAEALERRAN